MANQLLLLEDVENLGRSGEIVRVKPGYARNFLLPQKKAVIASKQTLRLQERLKEERARKAEVDKASAESLALRLQDLILTIEVKVDPEGHMYGSVSALDIVRLFAKEGMEVEKKHILLPHPIKQVGDHLISLKLSEGVPAAVTLRVASETVLSL